MRLLFLDFDGVLNSDAYFTSPEFLARIEGFSDAEVMLLGHTNHLDAAKIALLNRLIATLDLTVVIRSSWRLQYTLEELNAMLAERGATFHAVAKTPRIVERDPEKPLRAREILAYLESLVETPEAIVVLDDDHPRFDSLRRVCSDGRNANNHFEYFGVSCRPDVPYSDAMKSMRILFFVPLVLALGAGTGCAHSHQVRPLGKGNAAVHASIGGPMVGVFDIVLPVPIFSAGGSYGVTDNVEVLGHFDVTAAAFGTVHYDMGAAWHPIISEYGAKPTLTLSGGVHVLDTRESVLVAPTLSFISAWRLARRHTVYIGVDTFLPIRDQVRFVAGPLVGAELRLGKRVGLALEAKYFAPWYDTNPNPPEWFSPGGFGYVSALLGANIYFGDVK